ncbi:enterochelin esterase [Dictyobacter halimunensis]
MMLEDSSPRIAQLKRELEAGNPAALPPFWREIEEQQAPLIEPIPDDPTECLVTFVWRGTSQTRNVVLFARYVADDDIERHQLERLGESDLWYKTYRLRSDLRSVYQFSPDDSLVPFTEATDYRARVRGFQPDPLNARRFTFPKDEEDPEDFPRVLSLLELPDAPAQPWIMQHDDVPAGKVELQRFQSSILENERRVWIYTPPGYSLEHEPYALLVVFDGYAYVDLVPTPTIIDNLLHSGKIPPLVVVSPDSLNQETRNRELPCYQPHVDFLTRELLPWVRERYHVTSDPARTIVGGSSYGGLAAAYAALQASEVFGNVLSQSGSYWWGKDHPEDHTPEWLVQQFDQREHLPLRFYQEVGLFEPYEAMVLSNRHLRGVLQDKGYDLCYREFAGGHDYACWRGSLADGLQFLLPAGSSTSHRYHD